ncbi:MAG: serine/threonine protein kinase, partial [Myxococcales bacterium]|nr:serine/threonine protein kinase [Myxococcales bacterium]
MELAPGALIGTEVRLVRLLEEGGMGAVWVGEHIATQTEVAVKFVHRDLARRDPSVLERFEREATVLGSIQSPHVVRIFTKGKLPDGTPYIVMEFLKGESLVKRLERTGKWMSVEEVGTLLWQIAEALEPVHAQNMVHRDLKGENIFLIDPPERLHVKVLDFGLAKAATAPGKAKLTAAGTMLGSAEFMSPEQIISAMSVDRKADLWAVAALAYMALTLALPFSGDKLSMVLTAIRSGIFTLPTELRRDLPPAVDQWFRKAFHLDARRRFESAHQMSDAWQHAIGRGTAESAALLDIQASGMFMPPQVAAARASAPSTPGLSGVFAPPAAAGGPPAQGAGASGVFAPPGSPGASGAFAPPAGAGASGV